MGHSVAYLAVYSDLGESTLLLGAFTAQLALAEQAILVGAVLVEVGGGLVLPTLTALLLPNRRLCHLHNHKHSLFIVFHYFVFLLLLLILFLCCYFFKSTPHLKHYHHQHHMLVSWVLRYVQTRFIESS